MIELRWLTRLNTAPGVGPWEVRVLQYRYRYPQITQVIDAYPPKEWGWSEWQDVPEAEA